MAVLLELRNTGDPGVGAEIRALVEHHLDKGREIGGCRSSVLAKTTVGK
jgi:hypothetical protein